MSNPVNIDTVITYTGKLNKFEKSKVNAAVQSGKSLGCILDDIAMYRSNVTIGSKIQDELNAKVKNKCSSKVQLDLKKEVEPPPLDAWEEREKQKQNIRDQTNKFINLQKNKKRRK
jgi:hypothetical protein